MVTLSKTNNDLYYGGEKNATAALSGLPAEAHGDGPKAVTQMYCRVN